MHMIAARKLHGRRAAQAALLGLTDRQLADAGIDLTLAGRGKAADVAFDPNIEARS